MAKAAFWRTADTEMRKRGEQTGLDTPVVHALNDEGWVLARFLVCAEANALSPPPGDYERKFKTQRN